MKIKNIEKGFTLIEVLLYIALTGFLLGSTFIAAFQLAQESDRIRWQAEKSSQGGFIALISAIFLSIIMILSILSTEYAVSFYVSNVENKIKNQQNQEGVLSEADYTQALFLEDPNYNL